MSAPSKEDDPVEKIVETLFFAILLKLNEEKNFFYAPLDGKAEEYFGDAVIDAAQGIFVFEFKRSIENLQQEREKFGANSAEEFKDIFIEIGERLSSPTILRASQAHFLVTLAKFSTMGFEVCPRDLAASLNLYKYLFALMDDDSKPVSPPLKETALKLTGGMSFDDASLYFQTLSDIKKEQGGKRSSQAILIDRLIGFCFTEDGRLCVSHHSTHSNLIQMLNYVNAQANLDSDATSTRETDSTPRMGI